MLVQFGERYILLDRYPNDQKAEPRFRSTAGRLGLLAIQHLISNQIRVKWCSLWGVVHVVLFYKDVVRAIPLTRSTFSWRTPVATTVTRISSSGVHQWYLADVPVTAAVYNFWSFFSFDPMSYPNHLLRWRSRPLLPSSWFPLRVEVNGFTRPSITRSSPLPTIPMRAFPLFSITVFSLQSQGWSIQAGSSVIP